MSNASWILLVGSLLLAMGLTSALLKRLPVTSAIVYLAVGVTVGPTILGLFHFNPLKQSALLEVLTEVAALISLFAAGVKMPVPFSLPRWRVPILLATLSMALTVGMVAAFAYYVLGMQIGAAILLGAIVAPTDPVLATEVQIRHPGDRDRLRFALTCEAGMNDGSAFPFVVLGLGLLGLHDLGDTGLRWVLMDVLWATAAALAIGVAGGTALARAGHALRKRWPAYGLMDDFLGLGLIGVVYGVCVMANAWGFLAVFFAAVALRQTEYRLANETGVVAAVPEPVREAAQPGLGETEHEAEHNAHGAGISGGALAFKEYLERLSEVVLILLVGGTLFVNSWSVRAVGLALFLFLVARPLSVFIGLIGTRTPWRIRALSGWFGVRGIGSLYYLMYAIQHGLPQSVALELIQLTLVVVTLSIIFHGVSVKPIIGRFWRVGKVAPV
ncbi:cation:proton antiporter [Azoarcus sp. L1K30]|uniref:cation:proton antiporter n=1 Tax=Azoarcus sp. L1K30 TaxID=2820277 RepID=UPI001B80EAF9|nr:cation:proton antiporter [Azoarcus sp. L1K30]MBR0567481.1 cation:proton antiporter [Azoarcus sp. L1K30]